MARGKKHTAEQKSVATGFRSLSDSGTMAFNSVWIWSVAKANGFVLFRKRDLP
jgi:hypothetical protein